MQWKVEDQGIESREQGAAIVKKNVEVQPYLYCLSSTPGGVVRSLSTIVSYCGSLPAYLFPLVCEVTM